MNDEINKNNMIPGSCDEFTKAERDGEVHAEL